jgi:hypothetical protein
MVFHLKLLNTSKTPVRIWSIRYSFGYYSIYFKISQIKTGGGIFDIKRKIITWTVNVPDFISIQPGSFQIFELDLNDGTWNLKELYKADSQIKIDINGILEIAPGENTSKYNIMTGSYESNKLRFNSIAEIIRYSVR